MQGAHTAACLEALVYKMSREVQVNLSYLLFDGGILLILPAQGYCQHSIVQVLKQLPVFLEVLLGIQPEVEIGLGITHKPDRLTLDCAVRIEGYVPGIIIVPDSVNIPFLRAFLYESLEAGFQKSEILLLPRSKFRLHGYV